MSEIVHQDACELDRSDGLGDVLVEEGRALLSETARKRTSRRTFIKGVVASGAAVSAAGYLFRGPGGSRARSSAVTVASAVRARFSSTTSPTMAVRR